MELKVLPRGSPHSTCSRYGEIGVGIPELVIFEDGTERNFIANAAPLLSEDYMPYGAVAAVLDITDRNRAEEALRK
jgi:PAS domain-containing protein